MKLSSVTVRALLGFQTCDAGVDMGFSVIELMTFASEDSTKCRYVPQPRKLDSGGDGHIAGRLQKFDDQVI
jgi:hypothetical protein